MSKFADLGISAKVAKAIDEMGWTEPTPIQVEAVPVGLSGKDIFAQAQTGTGKTGTYAMIVMGRISNGNKVPSALILVPTRELANQVDQEIYKLSNYSRHNSTPVYGGASINEQLYRLRKGTDIVVGTPGRVKDMIVRGALDLSSITEFVIDEADRMFDMGFSEELDFIIDALPAERQTLLFSATMADDIKSLAFRCMKDPLEVSVSKDELVSDLTTQYYVPVPRSDKRGRLVEILSNGSPKTIVFCQTKKMVDELKTDLMDSFKVDAIHGDMPQERRERVIRNYRNNRFQVLVATDVAARGIDVKDIDCVVNYDVPSDPETYLHRIGRTGRAGKEGIAISFVTKMENYRVKMYERETGKKIEKLDISSMAPIETVHEVAPVERSRPHYEPKPVKSKPVKTELPQVTNGKIVLQINLGKDDGYGKTQVLDYVRSNAKLSSEQLGRVGLGSAKSFIEVDAVVADDVVDTLQRSKHGEKKIFAQIAPKKLSYSEKIRAKKLSASAPTSFAA